MNDMADNLIIVESPAKARTISQFLNGRYQVKATMGHLRDLPKSQFGIDLANQYEPKYITIRGKGDLIKELKAAAKKAKRVYLATDPDREGEAISWHLSTLLGIDPGSNCRIEFHEITEKAVKAALQNPRPINLNYVNAQQARRVMDRIVGYQLSPLLWRKLRYGLSAGRVQSVAVAMICDREEEIKAFVPEEYWTLAAKLTFNQQHFEAKLTEYQGKQPQLSTQAETEQILNQLEPTCTVWTLKKGERSRQPAAPFTTSTLQQEAAKRFGFTAKKTMMLAQQLYEGIDLNDEGPVGLFTYIRTDSVSISDLAYDQSQQYLLQKFGRDYCLEQKRTFPARRGAQEAHEAIRPTDVWREPERLLPSLSKDQYKLYKLVWERFLASQCAAAKYDYVTADLQNQSAVFRVNGSMIQFPGFLQLLKPEEDESDDEVGFLPLFEIGQEIAVEQWLPQQHFTQSPVRYNEALLIKTMEELGIGRPSTYAPTIETILKRRYVERKERRFWPTELGIAVTQMLKEHFHTVIDSAFTADMESELDRVEEGNLLWQEAIDAFYQPFSVQLTAAEQEIPVQEIADEVTDVICELCGRNMVIKHGRFGSFLACPGYPECKNTKNLSEDLHLLCPQCGEGKIVERRSRKSGRPFYGCSRYPECKFVTWEKPVERVCPLCGNLGMSQKINQKKGTVTYRCIKPECAGEEVVVLEEEQEEV
ncbi:MAG: type I DNA topoisomerase [Negativicutes bacterium]|nr:type I DNA topoisomerase [Negativicutes bacterium]